MMGNILYFEKPKDTRFVFDDVGITNPHRSRHYLFSIVVAVYNAENYLDETIESVLRQSLDFKKNVQLILVNDGSTDSSEKICIKYAKKYPNNILLINKKNGGVSSARNAGMYYVCGKYINFLDSDDKFGETVLESVADFFAKYESKTDVVTIRNVLFGDKTGDTWFNAKFKKGDRVINLWSEPQIYLNSVNNSFFHSRIYNQLHFDESISISEDLKVVNTVLFNKYSLGVLSSCVYYYRITNSNSSLAFSARKKQTWYFDYLNKVALWLFKYAKLRCVDIPKFLQYTLLRDLFNRFDNNVDFVNVIEESRREEYKELLFSCFNYIDDSVIQNNSFLDSYQKIYFLSIKHGMPDISINDESETVFSFQNDTCIKQKTFAYFLHCSIKEKSLILEGYIPFVALNNIKDIKVVGNCDKNKCFIKNFDNVNNDKIAFGQEKMLIRHYFKATINVNSKKQSEIKLFAKVNGTLLPVMFIDFGKWFPLNKQLPNSVFYDNGIMIEFENQKIYCQKADYNEYEKKESANIKYLKEKRDDNSLEAAHYLENLLVKLSQPKAKKKETWIISDRHVAAGDNGEALYNYIKNNRNEVEAYFAIDKSSKDYLRLKNNNFKLIDINSKKYKEIFAQADKIISSYLEQSEANPFFYNEFMKPIIAHKKTIFLQHGITKDDVSTYYSRKTMKIDLFVSTAKREYDSIVNNNGYLCDSTIVKLTGFPRYDLLETSTNKLIVLMPTWRNKSVVFGANGLAPVVDKNFEKSSYFKFYSELLKDMRLQSILKKYGYILEYFPHNNMIPTNDYFKNIPGIHIVEGNKRSYSRIFKEAALMITDYSSTAFDFAYLNKPIIYCQADADEFFSSHTYVKGYFSYENDGFGPVVKTVDEVITTLERILANNCLSEEKYSMRSKDFYAFRDKENSKRVYEEILSLNS